MGTRCLDSKFIRRNLDRGKGTQFFLDRCGISREEFYSRIKHTIWAHDAETLQHVLGKLEENDRAEEKRTEKKIAELPVEPAPTEEAPKSGEERIDVGARLLELAKGEEEASKRVMELENQREALIQIRRDAGGKLKNLRDALEKAEDRVRGLNDSILEIAQQDAVTKAKLDELGPELKREREHLDGIRSEIKVLKAPDICFYENGEIAPLDDKLVIVLDTTGHEGIWENLSKLPLLENISIKQVRQLAKLLAIRRNLDGEANVIFENAEIEKIYCQLKEDGWVW